MVGALLWLFNTVVILYMLMLLALIVLSWLTAFNALKPDQPVVAQVDRGVIAITNPVVDPVRKIVPSLGGIDLSPVVVILLLEFIRRVVNALVAGSGLLGGPATGS